MFLSLPVMLGYLNRLAKKNQTGPVVCYWCNNRSNFIKHGTYKRYLFTGDEQIKIQRHLCKHDQCRRTFSILPHPFLRIVHFTLCMYQVLRNNFDQQPVVAELVHLFGLTWQTTRQAIEEGRTILNWIKQEAQTDPAWAPSPCMHPPRQWSHFVRMFAAKFYPKRYGSFPPTEH